MKVFAIAYVLCLTALNVLPVNVLAKGQRLVTAIKPGVVVFIALLAGAYAIVRPGPIRAYTQLLCSRVGHFNLTVDPLGYDNVATLSANFGAAATRETAEVGPVGGGFGPAIFAVSFICRCTPLS